MFDIHERKTRLERSIEELYKAFETYEFTDRLGDAAFPGMCDPTEMLAYPLRQVPASAIGSYSWKALTTWGGVNDFKHFLPRLLELAISPQPNSGTLDPHTVFGKLDYGRWNDWPQPEKQSISEFLLALWAVVPALPPLATSSYTSFCGADECLDAIYAATRNARMFLEKWLHDATSSDIRANAAAQIARTVLDCATRLSLKGSANRYGEEFDRWSQTTELAECLEAAYLDSPRSEYAEEISHAEAFVRARLRAAER